jgi:hypothetical protein
MIWLACRTRIVLTELDGDFVIEGKDVIHHRIIQGLEVRQGGDEIFKAIRGVVYMHRCQWSNCVSDLIDNPKEAVAAPYFLHQVRLRAFGNLEKIAAW